MMMATNTKPVLSEIPSLTKVEQAQRAILEAIFAGAIRPGDRLVEATLARQLGVAQATVNQALQNLHAQSIVSKLTSKATTVSKFGVTELKAIFSVRSVLESMAAEAASRNVTTHKVEDLRRKVDQMRAAARTRDLPSFYVADYEFHQKIYRGSDNRFLFQACQAIAAAPFAYILCDRLEPLPMNYLQIAEDHEQIIQALQQGPEEAVRVVKSKVDRWLGWQSEFMSQGC